MAETETAQLYLVTPPDLDLGRFPALLARVLDAHPAACLRLSLATHDEDRLTRAADALRAIAHDRDTAVVIDTHVVLAERLGLDGVHLTDGARSVRAARKTLGPDAIVGAFCGQSRHDGMTAGELGADYVAFGPVSGRLGDGALAPRALFEWWTEMIEVPVVAEGGLGLPEIEAVRGVTDFVAIGEEIWREDDPLEALAARLACLTAG